MHIKSVLSLLGIFASLSPRVFNEPNFTLFTTSFEPIGPFKVNNKDYSLSGSYQSKVNISGVVEKMDVYTNDNVKVYSENKARHDIVARDTYNLTFTLPLKDWLTKDGISIEINLLNSTNEVIYNIASFNLKPYSKTRVLVKDYLREPYIINDVVVDPDDYSANHQETFLFDGFIDYFNVDSYYRIDLDDIYLTYSCAKPFPNTTGTLSFVDYDKVFPYLDKEKVLTVVEVPIETYENNGKIRFKFKDLMYVDPKTLDMSLVARPGFQLTRYFYLPINKCQKLVDQTFNLVMSDFGYGKINFTWGLRYTNERNLIGNCHNSDYCVVGEVV